MAEGLTVCLMCKATLKRPLRHTSKTLEGQPVMDQINDLVSRSVYCSTV